MARVFAFSKITHENCSNIWWFGLFWNGEWETFCSTFMGGTAMGWKRKRTLTHQLSEFWNCSNTELFKEHVICPELLFVSPQEGLKPGDRELIKIIKGKSWEAPRWEGPYIEQLTTPTTVKIQERNTWIHQSHCKLIKKFSSAKKPSYFHRDPTTKV